MKLADLDVVGADRATRRRASARRPRCGGRSSRCPRSARRARRGSGRGPGRAARRRRCRSPSRRARATAAMTAFSVAITLASSRKMCSPRRAVARASRSAGRPRSAAPSSAKAWMCGSSRRRPITSPPGGGTLAAAEAREQRPGEQERRADPAAELLVELGASTTLGGVDVDVVRARATRRRRRGRRAARASSRRRGSAGRCASVTGSSVSRHAARIGSAPFLFPAARTRAVERAPALDDEATSVRRVGSRDGRSETSAVAYPTPWSRHATGPGRRSRATRRARRCCATRSRSRRRRARTRARFGEDEELWGVDRAPARLRLRDPPDARQAPAGRRADPARGGLARRR